MEFELEELSHLCVGLGTRRLGTRQDLGPGTSRTLNSPGTFCTLLSHA